MSDRLDSDLTTNVPRDLGREEQTDGDGDGEENRPPFGPLIQIASDVPDVGTASTIAEFWDWCNRHRENLRRFRISLGLPDPACVATDEFRLIPEIVRQCRDLLRGFGANDIPDQFDFKELPQDQTPTGPAHFP